MTATNKQPWVNVNGLDYRMPSRPVAVVCIDGGDPAYLRQYLSEGVIPNIARFMTRGFATVAEGTSQGAVTTILLIGTVFRATIISTLQPASRW